MLGVRASAVAAVAAVAAVVTVGCGGGGDEGTESAKQVSEAKPSGDVMWCIGKDTTGAFTTTVDAFNKANPDANVELLELPTSADLQRQQQIQRLQAQSDECDVLGMDVIWTGEYAGQEWLYDVSSVIEDRQDDFIPSTVETAKYQDKYWAVPFNTNAGFLYYRTDQVQNPPDTWQQVYSEAKSDKGLVYQGQRYEGLTVDFLELLYSAGGQVVSDDGQSSEIDSDQAREALSLMVQGIEGGAVPKAVVTYMEEESRRAFEQGQATFMRNWPYAYALGKESSIADSFAVAKLPAWEGGEATSVLGGYNLGISAFSKNPEGALAFINFATTPEQQLQMGVKASLPPVLTEVYDDPQLKKAMPFAPELLAAVEQGEARPVSPVYQQISKAIYENVYAALQGDMSPDEAVSAMDDQVQEAIETF
jgi:multiple sugar transport system substrate-binding protein